MKELRRPDHYVNQKLGSIPPDQFHYVNQKPKRPLCKTSQENVHAAQYVWLQVHRAVEGPRAETSRTDHLDLFTIVLCWALLIALLISCSVGICCTST